MKKFCICTCVASARAFQNLLTFPVNRYSTACTLLIPDTLLLSLSAYDCIRMDNILPGASEHVDEL